jgi:hypothetical protein
MTLKSPSTIRSPILGLGADGWILAADYTYRANDLTRVTVPEGFVFDLASIPRVFWRVIAPFELSLAAPLVHDWGYWMRGRMPRPSVVPYRTYNRHEMDDLFREIMRKELVPVWRRVLAYRAVRVCGGRAWRSGGWWAT